MRTNYDAIRAWLGPVLNHTCDETEIRVRIEQIVVIVRKETFEDADETHSNWTSDDVLSWLTRQAFTRKPT